MASLPSIEWKWKENASAHHTDRYRGTRLVVRRGQGFNVILDFSGPPPPSMNIKFTAATGSTSALQQKTRVEFGISTRPSSSSWSAVQTSDTSTSLGFSISSPPNAAIGRYQLSIKTSSGATSSSLGAFVLLFNPWLPEDHVFLASNAERDEYVLLESGVIFRKRFNYISPDPWNYGQFQNDILEICLSMLDRSLSYRKDPTNDVRHRNDPGYIGRVLSAMVNRNDDYGVLEGKWRGSYVGGVHPTSWSGSVAILRKWKMSGFEPVKYGQCWVFAGVLTTVLRCLGIPTRPITNFESAHDIDRNLTVDKYVDSFGNPLYLGSDSDSIWNFHVWNESWFVRTDLGSTYKGWQILDATPQEISGGIYQCGPASLTAIKEGDVDLNYDTPFVFAETNADIVSWVYDTTTGEKNRVYSSDTRSVGKFISTKAVGSDARQDVTDNYKYPEGSSKEREVFQKAYDKMHMENRMEFISASLPAPEKPNVSGKFKVESPPVVGKDVSLVFLLTNLASAAESITANMTAWSMVYNGKPINEVWKSSLSVTLGPNEEKAFPVKIPYAEYKQHLSADNMIQATALCQTEEGAQTLVQKVIVLAEPTVTMKLLSEAKVGKEVKVEVVFTNPLEEELEDCVLRAEGSDLVEDTLEIQLPPLKAKETSHNHLAITPSRSGTKQLIIHYFCDKFHNIKAFETITVAD